VTPLELAVEAVGWAGALLILLGYVLITTGRLTGKSLVYQAINVVGATGFAINGWWHDAWPSTALNVVWLLIGVVASWGIMRARGSSTSAM
jgi:hypothetical protein